MKKLNLTRLLSLAPQPKPKQPLTRLQAHARRLTPSAYDDYEEEPATKLSTAFVVVLVLHLVAVGGIYAFHSIKAKRREADGTAATAATSPASKAASPTAAAVPQVVSTPSPKVVTAQPETHQPVPVAHKATSSVVQKGETPLAHLPAPAGPSAVVPQKTATPTAAPSAAAATVVAKQQPASVTPVKAVAVVSPVQAVTPPVADASQKTYTVMKGDNPVAIAKKMGVNYEEMLKINNVDDPRKLKIGQVLKMPAKKAAN